MASSNDTGDRFLAERMRTLASSGIRRIFDLAAKLKNPINFSIGQPDFAVPDRIKRAAIEAINADHSGYTLTHGITPLRERIAAEIKKEFDWEPEVLVTSGLSGGLVLGLITCLNPGDEVIYLDPYFVSYPILAELPPGKPVPVESYPDFQLDPARIEAAITDRTRVLLLNSPCNPTGVVFSANAMQQVANIARKHDLLIMSDEIYNLLCFDGPCSSPASYAPERTLLLRGFGKSYGATGWRLGYAVGPSAIIQQMAKLQQFTFVCAPHPLQHGAIAAFDTDISPQVQEYAQKRNLVCEMLADKYEFSKPAGGFYVFPKAPDGYANATAFVEKCIDNNVLVIPGCAFSQKDTHFRISYAVPNNKIEQGCQILRDLA